MIVTQFSIEGPLLIELPRFEDERGFFTERFQKERFMSCGLPFEFVQDNHSKSRPSVLRGLHYQPGQGKLVGVVRGLIWDVAVDIRPKSPTFGLSVGVTLDDRSSRLFWIPPGFAHGFCVLGHEPADVLYKVTEVYNSQTESGIMWNDPELKIQWPEYLPIVSNRDQNLMSFSDYKKAHLLE